ncbi:hypothetical protein [Methanococcoides burtonii]|uniref:hypothetical protein n=1 Tax=Methanococcoides burtonii TaxID=29291 RepID=UPI000045E080|nr:hypothetical protein [Methanococcoides burtonii]
MAQDLFFKKELIKELRRIVTMMKKEENLDKKLYLFSAAYGIAARTYRYSFSGDYLISEYVLNTSYGVIREQIKGIKSGDSCVEINNLHFEKIQEGLGLLADAFERDESILEPLEKILIVAFSTSGAGNYLKEKGMLTL